MICVSNMVPNFASDGTYNDSTKYRYLNTLLGPESFEILFY